MIFKHKSDNIIEYLHKKWENYGVEIWLYGISTINQHLICSQQSIYRWVGRGLCCLDWYCKVASNIDSAITTLFSISANEAVAASYFSCKRDVSLHIEYWYSKTTVNYNLDMKIENMSTTIKIVKEVWVKIFYKHV